MHLQGRPLPDLDLDVHDGVDAEAECKKEVDAEAEAVEQDIIIIPGADIEMKAVTPCGTRERVCANLAQQPQASVHLDADEGHYESHQRPYVQRHPGKRPVRQQVWSPIQSYHQQHPAHMQKTS